MTNTAVQGVYELNPFASSLAFVAPQYYYNTGTITQSGNTITGNGTTFTQAMVGGILVFGSVSGSPTPVFVTGYISATQLTVAVSQTIANNIPFEIWYGGFAADALGNLAFNNQIYNGGNPSIPVGFVSGYSIDYLSTTTATVNAGDCVDSTNSKIIRLNAPVTLNLGTTGVNGLDTGTIGATHSYYVFAIADSSGVNAVGTLASLSLTPALPSGYDTYRWIGLLITGGSSTILKFYQTGLGKNRVYNFDAGVSVLTTGSATVLTNINLSAAMPPLTKSVVNLIVSFIPNAAGDGVLFVPGGSTSTATVGTSGSVASVAQLAQLFVNETIVSSNPTIQYKNTAASGSTTAEVMGFTYSI